MIDLGLSEEYLSGYRARLNNEPFDNTKSDDWKMGWLNANQALKLKQTESGDCMYAKEEFDVKEAQKMIDLWLKDDAPEWIKTKMMGVLYEQWQNKNIRRFVQPDLYD